VIEIARACVFGQSTNDRRRKSPIRDLTKPLLKQGYDYRPIRIGDDAS